jgi:hypothetical protein
MRPAPIAATNTQRGQARLRDLKRGTLIGIIKDAGLTPGEFVKLLRG